MVVFFIAWQIHDARRHEVAEGERINRLAEEIEALAPTASRARSVSREGGTVKRLSKATAPTLHQGAVIMPQLPIGGTGFF
jgi:hypothetical protein